MTDANSSSAARFRGHAGRLAFAAAALFAFAIPWERSLLVPGIGALGRLLGLVAFAATLLAVFDGGGIRLRRPSLFLAVAAAFTIWAFASVFWSIDPGASFSRASTYAQLAIMAWVFWQAADGPHRQRALLQAYVLGSFAMVVAVAIGFVAAPADGLTRYSALAENENYLAQTLVLALPMAWYLTLKGGRWPLGWLNPLFIPACLLVLGLTASRGALVMSVFALSVVPLTLWLLPPARRAAILVVLAVGVAGAISIVPDANIQRLAETTDRIAAGDLTSRERIWAAGVEAYLNPTTPWGFGIGIGSGSYPLAVAPTLGGTAASHNAYLSVLVELGLVGALLFLALLLVPIAPMLKLPSLERWTYLALWSALLVAMLSSNWDYHRAAWLTLALLTTGRALVLGPTPQNRPSPDAGAPSS